MRDLSKYRVLAAASFALQTAACAAAFYMVGISPAIKDSWLAEVTGGFWLQFMWIWLVANGLIGTGGFLSSEIDNLFSLEVWRYASFRHWLWSKLQFMWSLNVALYGLAPLPFLLFLYPGEVIYIVYLLVFLILYGVLVSLTFWLLMLSGMETSYAFAITMLAHSVNVMFNGAGWPNTLQYFLIGERAGLGSLVVVGGLLLVVTWLLLQRTTIMAVSRRRD